MGEFHDAVSTLLEAFAHGISIIKIQRCRRKKEHIPIEPSKKNAESHLSKSLKKNRTEVKTAYGKDLARFGPGFAAGDVEAHLSLSTILIRLNAGLVSVIERFTRGQSTSADYQALLNLSNASRIQAIETFSQLSQRLSRSSLALSPSNPTKHLEKHARKRRARKPSSAVGNPKHTRSQSAPELSLTPLGPATTSGWVRPKHSRKTSSSSISKSSGLSTPPKRTAPSEPNPKPAPLVPQYTPPPQYQRTEKRKSIMSFASDSTKLGEIPEHKWARPAMLEDGKFPVTTYYPLEPYQEPEKQRSRFMRLFRR